MLLTSPAACTKLYNLHWALHKRSRPCSIKDTCCFPSDDRVFIIFCFCLFTASNFLYDAHSHMLGCKCTGNTYHGSLLELHVAPIHLRHKKICLPLSCPLHELLHNAVSGPRSGFNIKFFHVSAQGSKMQVQNGSYEV